ncbi:hypothetical protein EXIGLDRAFT_782157 [Exidia glandulosa HHB12029]|uniref:Phytocyanin domain-containing protein n=1 Tax=Exidia glandulosa HHB12029 TaxID=1314781 RepID=A0A165AYS9_EXIGL|nr:hypothetical protein EXIGLDRAFT_782157 [Exidia glandulosa HHB12029]
MRYYVVLAAAASVLAVDIPVDVGKDGFAFTPNWVSADVGDIVTFTFWPDNHTVTQTTFSTPCTAAVDPATGQTGVNSGFISVPQPGPGPSPISLNVTTTGPLWFACMQTGHCQQGMVFAINPTEEKSFSTFQAAAMGRTGTASPPSESSPSNPPVGQGSPYAPEDTSGAPEEGASSTDTSVSAVPTGACDAVLSDQRFLVLVSFSLWLFWLAIGP